MKALDIRLFGGIQITHAGQTSPVHITHNSQALLAFLLYQPHYSYHREQLIELFWCDQTEERARHCLNTALWRLRQILEPEPMPRGSYLLTPSTNEVSFNWDSEYQLDLLAFNAVVQRIVTMPVNTMSEADAQQLKQALQLYSGDLLQGIYENWALREREHIKCLYIKGLAHLMQFHYRHRIYEEGLQCGHRILALDPLREEIHRQMMRLYIDSDQRIQAIQQYENCCHLLKTELNIPPMEETRALYQKIIATGDTNDEHASSARLNQSEYVLQQLQLAMRSLDKIREQLQQVQQLLN